MVAGKILNVDGKRVAIHIKCREENPLLIQKYAHITKNSSEIPYKRKRHLLKT